MDAERLEKLTDKQRECLRMVIKHYSSKEMARELGIGVDAVDQRLKSAMRKLGVQSRFEAARMLSQHEGVDQSDIPQGKAAPPDHAEPAKLGIRPLLLCLGRLFPRTRRGRFLLWACLVAFVLALPNVGDVLALSGGWKVVDNVLHDAAIQPRSRVASGDIILVALDDRAVDAFGAPPWPRRHMAELVQQVARLGARRIYVNFYFDMRTSSIDDAALARVFRQVRQRLILPAYITWDPKTERPISHYPLPEFSQDVDLVHNNFSVDYRRAVRTSVLNIDVGDRSLPSIEGFLAGLYGHIWEFPINSSIDPATIPIISALDVMNRRVGRARVLGKDVVIGSTFSTYENVFIAPGYGKLPAVYVGLLGAETLKAGMPILFSWKFTFSVAVLLVIACGVVARRGFSVVVLGASIAGFVSLPFLFDSGRAQFEVVPALVLLIIVGAGLSWMSLPRGLAGHSISRKGAPASQGGANSARAGTEQVQSPRSPRIE